MDCPDLDSLRQLNADYLKYSKMKQFRFNKNRERIVSIVLQHQNMKTYDGLEGTMSCDQSVQINMKIIKVCIRSNGKEITGL